MKSTASTAPYVAAYVSSRMWFSGYIWVLIYHCTEPKTLYQRITETCRDTSGGNNVNKQSATRPGGNHRNFMASVNDLGASCGGGGGGGEEEKGEEENEKKKK